MKRSQSIALIVLVFIGFVLFFLLVGAYQSLQAEKTFHAERLTMDLICNFVETKGRWPNNWSELRDTDPSDDGFWDWPEDYDAVAKRVDVDFNYSLDGIDPESWEEFPGVAPNGIHYTQDSVHLTRLKGVLKKQSSRK